MALRKFSGSSGSTKVTSMPIRRKLTSNCVYVPPYSVLEETISSPGAHQAGDGQELRRLPARGGQAGDAAFERRHALLENGRGGVHDAGIDVAELLRARTERRRARNPRKRTTWSGRSGTARARLALSGVWPACRQRVEKPIWRAGSVWSAIRFSGYQGRAVLRADRRPERAMVRG